MTTSDRPSQTTQRAELYARLGGHDTFERLTRRFYEGVATDEVLAPMYEGDLDGGEERLRMFLEQYWGGPTTYQEQRGHPRLRMRHQPFRVTPDARDRWLTHMRAALDDVALDPEADRAMWDYFVRAADAMINTLEPRP
ncbi:globin [Georgenia sp. Z1491]|uniref:globin n=1 Tax=Georgenia sp. Z1491 TaxID=3416707 RepID=UPI003CEE1E74